MSTVTHDPAVWRAARLALLEREKELTRQRDEVSRLRRAMPWLEVSQPYAFDGPGGARTLAELFEGRSQLAVYHFMFGPGWEEGCPSCSFWMDALDGIAVHLRHRDVTLVAVSRAPLAALEAYRARMGWSVPWYSSERCSFNADFHVSFRPEQLRGEAPGEYNYRPLAFGGEEAPGLSVFAADGTGRVFHTYSCYSRGLDAINGAYQVLDLVPKGRDEEGLAWSMAWLRRHDAYD